MESLVALHNSAARWHWRQLPAQDSEQKILGGITAFVVAGRVRGYGLLWANDGWTVFPHHVTSPYLPEWRRIAENLPSTATDAKLDELEHRYAVIYEGCYYPIDPTIWADDSGCDSTLVKAVFYNKPEPAHFNLREDVRVGERVMLLGKPGQREYRDYGNVTGNLRLSIGGAPLRDFTLEANIRPFELCSGSSLVAAADGALVGIVVSGNNEGKIYAVKAGNVSDFIRKKALELGYRFVQPSAKGNTVNVMNVVLEGPPIRPVRPYNG